MHRTPTARPKKQVWVRKVDLNKSEAPSDPHATTGPLSSGPASSIPAPPIASIPLLAPAPDSTPSIPPHAPVPETIAPPVTLHGPPPEPSSASGKGKEKVSEEPSALPVGGPATGEKADRPRFSAERIYGHAPVEGADGKVVEHIRAVMKGQKERRQQAKANLAARIYRERALIPGIEREEIKKSDAGKAFLEKFDPGGEFPREWEELQVTRDRVREALGKDFDMRDVPGDETQVRHGGKHVYTLYRGKSAWMDSAPESSSGSSSSSSSSGPSSPHVYPNVSAPLVRPRFRKHGGGDKEYVHDDVGVPTRRLVYAIKSPNQLSGLRSGTDLVGRHVRKGRDIMQPTNREKWLLNQKTKKTLTDDEMLALHQEHGSGESQRGVSAASTAAPLLSNPADGFARKHPDAMKLMIDAATIPLRRGGPPEFRNFHQRIPGYEHAAVKLNKWKQGNKQGHFNWSTRKNREVFIRRLNRSQVVGAASASDLETLSYASKRWTDQRIADEYKSVRYRPVSEYKPL